MINPNERECTACGSCVQKCPKNCISLEKDANGFLLPRVQAENCIHCGLCNRVCPLEQEKIAKTPQSRVFACVHEDPEMLSLATSGGVFGALATHVLEQGGVVYGCAYTGHLQATHIRVETKDALRRLYGSKYLQSNVANTFRECETDLKAGRRVLYSGTPCQIAGLKQFLQTRYSNLLTVDIVCHGVASQDYFDKFIAYLEEKAGATCTDYSFRSKKNAGWSVAGMADFQKPNGNHFQKKQYYFSNYYYYHYLSCSVYRESCYSCKYASLQREGDITLGDFWGIEGLSIPLSVEKGCSLVLANNAAAADLLEQLPLEMTEVPMETAVKHNHQLSAPSQPRLDREELLRAHREDPADLIQRNFQRRHKKAILIGKVKYSIPGGLKRMLLKIRYKR